MACLSSRFEVVRSLAQNLSATQALHERPFRTEPFAKIFCVGRWSGNVVDVLQLSACSAFGLLLTFQTTFSTWCWRSARKYSPKQNRKGESHRNKSYKSCAEPFTPARRKLAELRSAEEKDLRD